MEKRAAVRSRTQVSVGCGHFSILTGTAMDEGTMLNCSLGGSYIEISRPMSKGTIVLFKSCWPNAESEGKSLPQGFRSISLAEVKWSQPVEETPTSRFGLGLKYLDV
jgi:hypothetical protein